MAEADWAPTQWREQDKGKKAATRKSVIIALVLMFLNWFPVEETCIP
jgi:hypothetical protein